MKTKLLIIIIGIIAASSILFFVLNPTNDHRAYELFPIELKVAEKLEDGSGWYFSGSVYDLDTEIKMSVRSPSGNIITTDAIIPSENGNFDTIITTGGPLWASAGKYILILEQGEFKELQIFEILENEISVPIGFENENIESERKILQCYGIFNCNASSQYFETCIGAKKNGVTIEQLCLDSDITIDNGCATIVFPDSTKTVSCHYEDNSIDGFGIEDGKGNVIHHFIDNLDEMPCRDFIHVWQEVFRIVEEHEILVDKYDTCFDETFGGLGNRHPAFLGWHIPDICTHDMVKFLKKNSNMFDNNVPYRSPLDGDVFDSGVNPDDMVQCENELLENRDNEPSWPGR